MLLQEPQSKEQLVVREQSESALSARQGLLDRLQQLSADPSQVRGLAPGEAPQKDPADLACPEG